MLIGLNGKARSGKDTVFGMLSEIVTPLSAGRLAFADPLKISAAHALGVDNQEVRTMEALKLCGRVTLWIEHGPDDYQEVVLSGREFLQRYGTEAHRKVFGDDFWIKTSLPDNLDHHGIVLVITDARFENEADAIHDHGGYIWHIDRPSVAHGDTHASEQELPDEKIDRTIRNHKDIGYLRREVNLAWKEIYGKNRYRSR